MGQIVRAKLKFKDPLPWKLQSHLCNTHGFRFYSRKYEEYVILEKYKAFVAGNVKATEQKVLDFVQATAECTFNDQIELGRKCYRIKANFHDPKTSAAMIRFRVGEMSRTLNKAQKQWCMDWVERNVEPLE